MRTEPSTIVDVLEVHRIAGNDAEADQASSLLVEVPHGADRTRHYERWEKKLSGTLPNGLVDFFHLNTDVGAWDLGVAVANALVHRFPTRSCTLVRCLIPRTFVDCNRPADYEGALNAGGLTPGIAPYIVDAEDKALLLEHHKAYVSATSDLYAEICGRGGHAFIPHSYGPRSLGIEKVDADIVKNLHWACEPGRHDTWPLRAEVDLLTRDPDGNLLCDPRIESDLVSGFAAAGYSPKCNDTYSVHPASLAYTHCVNHPQRVLCAEVRRDLLVDEWTPFAQMRPNAEKIERAATVIADYYASIFAARTDGASA